MNGFKDIFRSKFGIIVFSLYVAFTSFLVIASLFPEQCHCLNSTTILFFVIVFFPLRALPFELSNTSALVLSVIYTFCMFVFTLWIGNRLKRAGSKHYR